MRHTSSWCSVVGAMLGRALVRPSGLSRPPPREGRVVPTAYSEQDSTRTGPAEEIKKAGALLGRCKGLRKRKAGYRGAFGSNVIAAQFPQRICDEFGRDLFPPAHVEVCVVQGFSDAGSERSSFRDGLGS